MMRTMIVAAVLTVCGAGVAVADPFTEEKNRALQAVQSCARLADDADRLRCYDGALGRVEEALAPPTPEEQAAAFGQRAERPMEPDDGFSIFGLTIIGAGDAPAAPEPAFERITSVTAKISDYAFTPDGKIIVFLENGHVWRQIDATKPRVPSDPEERIVTVREASLGSYMMTIGEANRSYRVRRVR